MPKLKQITCNVEYAGTNIPFKEYGTRYDDAYVETFIPVSLEPQEFLIHLKSHKFISSGLAVLVYIDGVYQCNRNRTNLRPIKSGEDPRHSEVEYRLRQKEKKTIDKEVFIGRQWQFDMCNIVPMEQVPPDSCVEDFDHLGEIEVVVLRCAAPDGGIPGLLNCETSSFTDLRGEEIGEANHPIAEAKADNAARDTNANETNYHAPSVVEEPPADDEDIGGLFGLFDGAGDDPHRFGLDGFADSRPQQHQQNSGQQFGWMPTGNAPNEAIYGPIDQIQQGQQPMQTAANSFPPPHAMMNPYAFPMPMTQMPFTYPPYMMPHPYMPPSYPAYTQLHFGNDMGIPSAVNMQAPNNTQHTTAIRSNGFDNVNGPTQPVPNQPATSQAQAGWGGGAAPAVVVQVGQPAGQGIWGGAQPQTQTFGSNWNRPGDAGQWQNGVAAAADVNHSGAQDWDRSGTQGQEQNTNTWGQDNNGQQTNAADGWGADTGAGQEQNNGGNDRPASENNNAGNGDGWDTKGGNDNNANNDDGDGWGDNNNNGGSHDKWSNPGNNDHNGHNQDDQAGWPNNGNNNDGGSETWANNKQDNVQSGWEQNNDNHGNFGDGPAMNGGQYHQNQIQQHQNGEPGPTIPSARIPGHAVPQYHQNQRYPGMHPVPVPMNYFGSGKPLRGPFGVYHHALKIPKQEIDETPTYDVPRMVAETKGATHQVRPAGGHLYSHKKVTPVYLDTLEEPYARFVFKYRLPHYIEQLTGQPIPPQTPEAVVETQLQDMNHEELLAYAQGLRHKLKDPRLDPVVRQLTSPRLVAQPPGKRPNTKFLGHRQAPAQGNGNGAAAGPGLGITGVAYGQPDSAMAQGMHQPQQQVQANTGIGGGHGMGHGQLNPYMGQGIQQPQHQPQMHNGARVGQGIGAGVGGLANQLGNMNIGIPQAQTYNPAQMGYGQGHGHPNQVYPGLGGLPQQTYNPQQFSQAGVPGFQDPGHFHDRLSTVPDIPSSMHDEAVASQAGRNNNDNNMAWPNGQPNQGGGGNVGFQPQTYPPPYGNGRGSVNDRGGRGSGQARGGGHQNNDGQHNTNGNGSGVWGGDNAPGSNNNGGNDGWPSAEGNNNNNNGGGNNAWNATPNEGGGGGAADQNTAW